jgi:hypothetical protein
MSDPRQVRGFAVHLFLPVRDLIRKPLHTFRDHARARYFKRASEQ